MPCWRFADCARGFRSAAVCLQRVTGHVRAVDGVDLTIFPGETLALVGESGCGKTRSVAPSCSLLEPTGGNIWFRGTNLSYCHGCLPSLSAPNTDRHAGSRLCTRSALHGTRCDRRGHGGFPDRSNHDERTKRVAELMRQVSLDPETMWRLPARVFRRPAPTHLHRSGTCGRSNAADLRRGNVGARRFDPGADSQSACRSAGGAQAHLSIHNARSRRRAVFRDARSGHVSRPHRGDGPTASEFSPRRVTHTPRRCSHRSPLWTQSGEVPSRLLLATFHHRRTHLPVAIIIPDAPPGSQQCSGSILPSFNSPTVSAGVCSLAPKRARIKRVGGAPLTPAEQAIDHSRRRPQIVDGIGQLGEAFGIEMPRHLRSLFELG